MPQKSEIIHAITHSREQARCFAQSLSAAERAASGTRERWAARDILWHIGVGLRKWSADLVAARAGQAPEIPGEDWNDTHFAQYQDRSWDEIDALLETGYAELLEQVQALSEEDWRSPQCFPWMQGGEPWQHILDMGFVHPLTHLFQANFARGELDGARAAADLLGRVEAALFDDSGWQMAVHYQQACFAAQLGDTGQALDHLAAALARNPDLKAWAREDPNLAALRGAEGFEELVKEGE